jgi:hypothetical protein
MTARISSAVAATIAVAAAVALTGTPAQAAWPGAPHPVGFKPTVVHRGAATWIEARWITTVPVCAAKLTVSGTGVTVDYPSNNATFTSFSRGDSLWPGESDFTAFRVTATSSAYVTRLTVNLAYTRAPHDFAPGDACTGPLGTRTVRVSLGVVPSVPVG